MLSTMVKLARDINLCLSYHGGRLLLFQNHNTHIRSKIGHGLYNKIRILFSDAALLCGIHNIDTLLFVNITTQKN